MISESTKIIKEHNIDGMIKQEIAEEVLTKNGIEQLMVDTMSEADVIRTLFKMISLPQRGSLSLKMMVKIAQIIGEEE